MIIREAFNSLSSYGTRGNQARRLQTSNCCDCSLPHPWSTNSTNAIFYAIGDVPYDNTQSTMLKQQIQAIPTDAEFLIHLGDIKSGGGQCVPDHYLKVANILRLSKVPVFIIPGDNEWNDCINFDEAWAYWKTYFLGFNEKWLHVQDFAVEHQEGRPENFRFIWKNTLFIGLNLVGGRVQSAAEWINRLTDEVTWVITLMRSIDAKSIVLFGHANPRPQHDEFFQPLKVFLRDEFKKDVPILYLHGDGHSWQVQSNYLNQQELMRIQVRGGASEPPLRVEVVNGNSVPDKVFQYDRGL